MDSLVSRIDVRSNVTALTEIRLALKAGLLFSCAALRDVPYIAAKVGVGKLAWQLAKGAEGIDGRIEELRYATPDPVALTPAYARFLSEAGRQDDPEELFRALFILWVPDLQQAVLDQAEALSNLSDPESVDLLLRLEALLRQSLSWFREPRASAWLSDITSPWLESMSELFRSSGGLSAEHPEPGSVSWEDQLSALRRSLIHPEREPAREPLLSGGGAAVAWEEAGDQRKSLHSIAINVEVCAAEICGQMILEYTDDMPWQFTVDMARQVFDEVRHAEIQLGRMAELGGHLGDYDINIDIWRKFRVGNNALEQLMIQHRLGEGLGLDASYELADKFSKEGEGRTARLFDYVTADEVNHVTYGNRWIRAILEDDDERVMALEEDIRARLTAAGLGIRPAPIYAEGRRRAGFTQAELERLSAAWNPAR